MSQNKSTQKNHSVKGRFVSMEELQELDARLSNTHFPKFADGIPMQNWLVAILNKPLVEQPNE